MISGGREVLILIKTLFPEWGAHARTFHIWGSGVCSRTLPPTCDVLSDCSRSTQVLRTYGNFRDESIKTKYRFQDLNTPAVALRYSYLADEREISIDSARANPV